MGIADADEKYDQPAKATYVSSFKPFFIHYRWRPNSHSCCRVEKGEVVRLPLSEAKRLSRRRKPLLKKKR